MATNRTTSLGVQGIHRVGCADDLGRSLSRIEGVIRAEADHNAGQVEVRFEPEWVSDDDLHEDIRAVGFEPA